MSADLLRRAAALMRARAEAAEKVHASPWRPMGAGSVVYRMTKRMSGTVAEAYPKGGSAQQVATTEHVAAWHPAVTLAVADWLDSVSSFGDPPWPKGVASPRWTDWSYANAVARAYLGEQP